MTCSTLVSISWSLHRSGDLEIVSVLVFLVDRVRPNLCATQLNLPYTGGAGVNLHLLQRVLHRLRSKRMLNTRPLGNILLGFLFLQ